VLAGRVRTRIASLGEQARQPSCVRDGPTAEALGLTLLLAAWLPGLAAYLGWRIETSPEATQFARCLGGGIVAAALFWASLELPRQLLRRGGIAEAHFGWPAAAVSRLRRDHGRLAAVAVPLVLLIQVLELRGEDAWKESLGRLAFVLLVGVLAAFAHRSLRRPHGALAALAGTVPPLRWRMLHGVALALPLLLGAVAFGGYYWTALRLAARAHWTLGFLLALLVLLRLSARWSLLAQRRLAILRARELEAARSARAEEGLAAAEPEEAPLDPRRSPRRRAACSRAPRSSRRSSACG
jgi:potassium efflux system protein